MSDDAQLWPLVRLRWQMIRSPHARWGLVLLSLTPLAMVGIGLRGLELLPEDQAVSIELAAPTLFVGFLFLAVIAPLAAGGGHELYPSEELVAYPVRPGTVFRASLLLAPANLAWLLNVMSLLIVTAYAVGPVTWRTVASGVSVIAFVAMVTVIGQAVAWAVVGVRQSRRGRISTWLLAGGVAASAYLVIRLDLAFRLIDRSPTGSALENAHQGYDGRYLPWLLGVAIMVGGALLAAWLGTQVAGWALRRPGDHSARDGDRTERRRRTRDDVRRELVAVDRASVWRSVPLRRGFVVLLVLPGLAAGLAGMAWQSLILLPGLVAAGAGLLFGINAFALDGSGSTWLSTLPHWPHHAFAAKAQVYGEYTLVAVGAVLLGAGARAQPPSSAAEVTAAGAAALAAVGIVVATGMRTSLRQPHRAELVGTRDTPAPPGVMALHSLKLACLTTGSSLVFAVAAISQQWWLPVMLLLPVLLVCWLSLDHSRRAWLNPHVRGYVVATVSGG